MPPRVLYQTTCAMVQFKPEPMPKSATWSPLFKRPASRSFDNTIGEHPAASVADHVTRLAAEGLLEAHRRNPRRARLARS